MSGMSQVIARPFLEGRHNGVRLKATRHHWQNSPPPRTSRSLQYICFSHAKVGQPTNEVAKKNEWEIWERYLRECVKQYKRSLIDTCIAQP